MTEMHNLGQQRKCKPCRMGIYSAEARKNGERHVQLSRALLRCFLGTSLDILLMCTCNNYACLGA